jgi:hypothetical protein
MLARLLVLLVLLKSTQSHFEADSVQRKCKVEEVMMFCNQETTDTPEANDGYADAKASCFPQLKKAGDWHQCLLRKSETRRAYLETTKTLKPTPGMSFNWASYDQLRTHMVMDCGLCLSEQSNGFVPLLPAPEYLTVSAETKDTPNLRKSWESCSASDVTQYCLQNTWQAKHFKKSTAYDIATNACFPYLGKADNCRVDSKLLNRIYADAAGNNADPAFHEVKYENAKLELVRECDLCISKKVHGYKPLLEASLVMDEYPSVRPHNGPPPVSADMKMLENRVRGQQKDVDAINNENKRVETAQSTSINEEEKLLKAQKIQEKLFANMVNQKVQGDGSSSDAGDDTESAGASMQRGGMFIMFVALIAAVAMKFLPDQQNNSSNSSYGSPRSGRGAGKAGDGEDEHPLVECGEDFSSGSVKKSVPTYSNPRRRSSAGLEVEL